MCAADESEQGDMKIENRFLRGARDPNFVSKSGRGREKESMSHLSAADRRIQGAGVCNTVLFVALTLDGWRRFTTRVDCWGIGRGYVGCALTAERYSWSLSQSPVGARLTRPLA